MACAQGIERVAAAGTTATGAGWRASLFVTRPEVKDDAFPLDGSSTVGARLSRPLSKHARVSVDVFNVFDAPTRPLDPLAVTRSPAAMGIAENYLFHPSEGRGVRLGFRITF